MIDVCIYHIPVFIQFFFHFFCSLFCISFRAKSIRTIQKVCFKDRFYHYLTGLLHNPVPNSGHSNSKKHLTTAGIWERQRSSTPTILSMGRASPS